MSVPRERGLLWMAPENAELLGISKILCLRISFIVGRRLNKEKWCLSVQHPLRSAVLIHVCCKLIHGALPSESEGPRLKASGVYVA